MHGARSYMSRFIRLLTIGLYLLCNTSLAVPTQSADHLALSALINKFFEAYQRESLADVMSLWSAQSAEFAAQKQAMQHTFEAAQEITLESLAVKSLTVDGDKANVRVVVRLRTKQIHKSEAIANSLNRTFHCIREGGDWKIRAYLSSEDELAIALSKAETEQERLSLLAQEKELVTPQLQMSLVAQGDRLFKLGSYPQAHILYRLAVTVAEQRGDLRGKAVALRSIGTIYYYRGDYDEALLHYRESLRLADEFGGQEERGRALNNIGNVFFAREKYAEALGYYEQSLKLAEESGNKAETARSLNNLGNIYAAQDDYLQALGYYKKSMLLKDELSDRGGVSIALYNMGLAFYRLGNYTKALEHYAGSLKITEELGRKAGVASILRAIGDIYYSQGNNVQALINYKRSLTLTQALGDRAGTATTLNSIGQSLSLSGRYAEALEYHRQSLKLAEELDDRKEIIGAFNGIGLIHQSQRDYPRALEYYRKSLNLREKQGKTTEIVYALRSIGNVDRLAGDNAQAVAAYQRGLKLAEESGYVALAASLLNDIGTIYYAQGSYAKAIETSARAARMAERTGESQIYADARLTCGKAYHALGRIENARQAFADAIENLKQPRRDIFEDRQEQQFFKDRLAPYHAMIALLVGQNRLAEALDYAEMAKGRVLSAVIRDSRGNITGGMSQREREQEQSYTEEIISLSSQIHYEKLRQPSGNAHLSNLTARLREIRQKHFELENSLYAAHPKLKVNRGEVRPPALNEARLLLPDAKSALLEFVVTQDRTYLFVLTKGGLKVYQVEISREELARHVNNLRKNLVERTPDFSRFARQLYDLLLKPARKQLEDKSSLCIVPDSVLWQLPFNALQSKESRFLIEDYAVFHATSLATLRAAVKTTGGLSSAGAPVADRKLSPRTLLAFANQASGKEIEDTIKLLYGEGSISSLETEREVRALESLYAVAQSKFYVGAEASEERAKEELGKYRTLYFATSAIIDNHSPMSSSVLLSQAEGSSQEDGLLMASELLQLNLQAGIAVLSACQNAGDQRPGGEGIIALSWAFGVAGCPALAISQWTADSASTTDFMLEFHRKMNFESRKSAWFEAEALRSAGLKLLTSEAFRHPYYWSRFMLVSRN